MDGKFSRLQRCLLLVDGDLRLKGMWGERESRLLCVIPRKVRDGHRDIILCGCREINVQHRDVQRIRPRPNWSLRRRNADAIGNPFHGESLHCIGCLDVLTSQPVSVCEFHLKSAPSVVDVLNKKERSNDFTPLPASVFTGDDYCTDAPSMSCQSFSMAAQVASLSVVPVM